MYEVQHPDNSIPANPYSTPQHIVPGWYFLWFFDAILRSWPNSTHDNARRMVVRSIISVSPL